MTRLQAADFKDKKAECESQNSAESDYIYKATTDAEGNFECKKTLSQSGCKKDKTM